ncbi:DUF2975 domain-containing protein [Flavobacteriaceae bacterium M23B6Z8]
MSNTTNLVFKGLQIASWIIFIVLSIDAGGLIINFTFSLINPELVGDLYKKLDLTVMYEQSKWAFFSAYSFVLTVAILKAYLFYIVVRLIQKMDLSRPFSSFVSNQISKISYYTFSIGIISHLARQTTKNLGKRGFELDKLGQFWVDSQAFILMAAVIYLIAFIFKKGLEIQIENDLTV